MPDSVVDDVLARIRTDRGLPGLVAVLNGLNEKQRKALSGPVGRAAEAMGFNRDGRNAAALAVLGCVTGVRQASSRLEWLELDEEAEELAVQVVSARRPHWLPALPEALLVGQNRAPRSFRLVRALYRAGLVDRPQFPEYVLSMVRGLVSASGWLGEGPGIVDHLRADPGLLSDEVWELFTTEGAGRLLAGHDSWFLKPQQHFGKQEPIPARPERTWLHALVDLADADAIERARLLDATIGAFFRDWPASDIGWFVKFHDSLSPSTDELVERQASYGRLLTVEPGTAVNLGLRAIAALLDANRLDPDTLITNAPAALTRSDKGPAVEALKLLNRAGTADASIAGRVAEVVSVALTHGRVDVQERALSVLASLVPDEARRAQLVDAHVEGLAPSLRTGPRNSDGAEATAKAAADSVAPLQPVADPDELAELLATLVEEADDPAEVERLLEGTARLANHRPTRGREALLKRLGVLAQTYFPGPWTGQELRADLVQLGFAWLMHHPPGKGFEGREYGMEFGKGRAVSLRRPDWSLAALTTMRVHEVATAIATGGGTLLSFPVTRNGGIPAHELNERVSALGRLARPLPLDADLALLRVPPDDYEQLRLPTAHRIGRRMNEQLPLLRGHRPDWQLVIGSSAGVYRTDQYPRGVTWRDLTAPEGAVDNMIAAVLDRRDPLPNLALEAADGEYSARFEQVTAMWPLMLPHHPDLLAAHAHPRLNRALTKNRSGTESVLEALGNASRKLGPPAMSALVLGLAAKNGVERTRAVDAIIDLSGRSHLDGPALGQRLAELLRAESIVGSRVVKGLADAAGADSRACAPVIACLTEVLGDLAGRRDAHLYVDLLAQLAIAEGSTVQLPEPLAVLAAGRQNSMLARACRRIPQDRS